MNFKDIFLLCIMSFVTIHALSGQGFKIGLGKNDFKFIKGDDNVSVVSLRSTSSSKCSVVEYSEFLVLVDVPYIPVGVQDTSRVSSDPKFNPLITFLDSIYSNKPIKYILNTHHHGHSLSTVSSFLENGATLVTAAENIEYYDKKRRFGKTKSSKDYTESIIQVTADTTLLADTSNPIEVLHLKKSDYSNIPTKVFLFFNFPAQKLLAASCMVKLYDVGEKYGYKGILYTDRLPCVEKIIADKNLRVENTLQLSGLKVENGIEKPAIYSMSHFQKTLTEAWSEASLSEHFQNMSYTELHSKKDSIFDFFIENDIPVGPLNHAVYALIDKKEYQKSVILAQIAFISAPCWSDLLDSLGEAYFNNGEMDKAKHYDKMIDIMYPTDDRLGLTIWENNRKMRLEKDL